MLLKGRRHLRVLKGAVFHAETEPYVRKSEMSRKPEPASTIAAAPNPIEFLYVSDGRCPFSDAVTSENRVPWPATATVWPSLDVAMQKNIVGYQYWFHIQLDFRQLAKS